MFKGQKILIFNNHSEASLSHCLLYGRRLGMEVFFGAIDFLEKCGVSSLLYSGAYPEKEQKADGSVTWSHSVPYNFRTGYFGVLDNVTVRDIFFNEFIDTKFDYILLTLPELLPIANVLKRYQPGITVLAYSGNVGMVYPNNMPLICTSKPDYRRHAGTKLLITHELPLQMTHIPIKDNDKYIVRSCLNHMSAYPWHRSLLEFEQIIGEVGYKLVIGGFDGRDNDGFRGLEDAIHNHYSACRAGIHMKHIDGYGLCVSHWLLSGRPLLIGFKYYEQNIMFPLIEEWGVDIPYDDAERMAEIFCSTVDEFTPARSEDQSKDASVFFDYDGDEQRVRSFLSSL
tara:strand:+ start:3860 stop:4882 length:1023 start_codon:yes stop_codon:yes gene_type:complete